MEFKGTSVYEKSNEYAKSKCSEEIGDKFIPETNLTAYDACEIDFRNGYNQALEDVKALEMLEMLESIVEYGGVANFDKIKDLIKQVTEI